MPPHDPLTVGTYYPAVSTRPFSRVSQIRWLGGAFAVITCVAGIMILLDRHPGCAHQHSQDGPCEDLHSYSPHVVAGWVVIALGLIVFGLAMAGTAIWLRTSRTANRSAPLG